ncbi:MAG: MFS transporter [Deltaproteobacteria bacterium]|nr:MFS transporter [Deltaproteobacteria bacterium]
MPDNHKPQPRVPFHLPFYYGWFIIGLSFLAYLAASAVRASPSVLIHPLEKEFGWGRTAISSAASLNLLVYGFMAPVGGWLLDRFGARRVIMFCLSTIALAVAGTIFVDQLWQFILIWGVVLGIATGVTPALSASVASRWFIARRGLAVGILTNANATGQVIFLPILMALIVSHGWRPAMWLIVGTALLLLPAIYFWLRDYPSEIGLEPYTDSKTTAEERSQAQKKAGTFSLAATVDVFKTATFWLLSATFFVCGLTSNGLVGTHMIPYAIERGIPEVAAATAVGIMGVASFIGTTFAGWLCDRVDPRKVLSAAYLFRGLSLFVLPYVTESYGLFVFAVLYGLDWFATGPSTIAIIAKHFGQNRVGMLFGLVFVSHQIGSAIAALGAGWIYSNLGEYHYAFLSGAVMGLLAAAMALIIRSSNAASPTLTANAEPAGA